jgi:hypothetical protein
LGEADFETKSGKGRRNFGTDYSCSEFHGGFNGAKTGFLSYTVWDIFVIEIGKFRIRPLRIPQSASFFSVHRPNKKKLIVRKSSLGLLLLESKRIFFKSIIDRDINDLVRYPFGTISK